MSIIINLGSDKRIGNTDEEVEEILKEGMEYVKKLKKEIKKVDTIKNKLETSLSNIEDLKSTLKSYQSTLGHLGYKVPKARTYFGKLSQIDREVDETTRSIYQFIEK